MSTTTMQIDKVNEHKAAVKAHQDAIERYYAAPTAENAKAMREAGMACEIARWALTA